MLQQEEKKLRKDVVLTDKTLLPDNPTTFSPQSLACASCAPTTGERKKGNTKHPHTQGRKRERKRAWCVVAIYSRLGWVDWLVARVDRRGELEERPLMAPR